MNVVILTGRAVRDAEMRRSARTGKPFCTFRMAVEGFSRGPNMPREVDFINCLAFQRQGEKIGRELKKGFKIVVYGSIKTYERYDEFGAKKQEIVVVVRQHEWFDKIPRRDALADLVDGDGELLVPKEITQSVIKQIDGMDEDMPEEFISNLTGGLKINDPSEN